MIDTNNIGWRRKQKKRTKKKKFRRITIPLSELTSIEIRTWDLEFSTYLPNYLTRFNDLGYPTTLYSLTKFLFWI